MKPSITQLEKDYVNDALDKGDVGYGEYIGRFEQAWADYNKLRNGVSCNSGTTALYLALLALGIGKGDEVIVPEYTMVSTAWAVTYTGAKPVFIDCKDDLNIDVDLIEQAISKKTKAIIPVHIYGRRCDMESITHLAVKHNLYVVEDMAEAHGIRPASDIACYSFHGSKILTTGGGGMCLTDKKEWADEMRRLSHLYLNKEMNMLHEKIGHNFRMSNIQAAIGLAQVERIDEILEKRKMIEYWYTTWLPINVSWKERKEREVVWVFDIDCGLNQEQFMNSLAGQGRYGFKPMSQQPMYLQEYQHLKAYEWSKRIIYLPVYYDMTEDDVKNICVALG
jgi:dTDP-4-amino-4,6-dideoxygalactose transaminase